MPESASASSPLGIKLIGEPVYTALGCEIAEGLTIGSGGLLLSSIINVFELSAPPMNSISTLPSLPAEGTIVCVNCSL